MLLVGNGVHDIAISGILLVLILAGITLGGEALIVFGLLSALGVLIVGIAEIYGFLPNSFGAVGSDIAIIAIIVLAGAFLLRLLLSRLQQVIQELKQSEKQQIQVNTELLVLKDSLEQRVMDRNRELEDRTMQLEVANQKARIRASQFEAVTQVTQAINSIHDLQGLLPREQLLHAAQIGAAVEQMGGEAVAQAVRGQALADAAAKKLMGGGSSSQPSNTTANSSARTTDDGGLGGF